VSAFAVILFDSPMAVPVAGFVVAFFSVGFGRLPINDFLVTDIAFPLCGAAALEPLKAYFFLAASARSSKASAVPNPWL
jgi:hypothetical protein